jgi:hypothetical protein
MWSKYGVLNVKTGGARNNNSDLRVETAEVARRQHGKMIINGNKVLVDL